MTSLVVVTGPPEVDVAEVADAVAVHLRRARVSLDRIQQDLAHDAEHTPDGWLRLDAEAELERRIVAFGGVAVVDVRLADHGEAERLAAVLGPWWEGLVEVRCQASGSAVPPLGASRTVVLDGTRPPEAADVAAVVRDETPTASRTRRR